MFGNLFKNSLASAPSLPFSEVKLQNFKAYESELPPVATLHENFDAVLLTGSVADIYEKDEKKWIAELLDWTKELHERNLKAPAKERVSMIGSCFGHQAINAALGGVVAPNPNGYENGLIHVSFTEAGKAFFGQSDMDVFEAEEDEIKVMQVHGASVIEKAPILENLAFTEMTPHQATRFVDDEGKTTIITTQWHPEFQVPVVRNIIELIRKAVDEKRYAPEQYKKELGSMNGAGEDAAGSIPTGVKMLQVAGRLI